MDHCGATSSRHLLADSQSSRLVGLHIDQQEAELKGSNVVAFDYRGYGLSPGVPLEESCYEDATAAWNWVASAVQAGLTEGKKAQDLIAVVGHSLGGPIGSHLVTQLEAEGTRRALLCSSSSYRRGGAQSFRHYGLVPRRTAGDQGACRHQKY